ncbi:MULTISPECIES: hypothetical protein [Pectobacterium]|uniref:hypothetical protein n=1 Tax=Pectobacterium TaxID=122277 RepID=UPI0001A443B7|nr:MULTISPECIES: hypothetical protein [Pectobacterium]KFX10142.1 hypothetical protein KP17_20175 [Pectobacterium parvum]MCL6354357.1 hypothetical protein [Pectobacterium parmentieri]MCL6381635.1 hypothetical protein [Pectobacterium parmentieri]QLL92812.1 hypothetical protein HER17_07635 [Pectobacterium carotovorum]GKW36702.1 hypothetical protein PEC301875_07260 [Pectobacterium carotovorum subsp. carotovorum]
MSLLFMRRFWIGVLLPVFIDWLFMAGAIQLWWLWLPISAPLLIWAFFAYRKNRKEEADYNDWVHQQWEEKITTEKFEFCGRAYTFQETLSGTVISYNPNNDTIWVKTDAGDETQISAHGLPFRESHRIKKYEFNGYHDHHSYASFHDALIVNETTKERHVNMPEKCFIVFGLTTLTLLLFIRPIVRFTASVYSSAMPVPSFFPVTFIVTNIISAVSFIIFLFDFKNDDLWDIYLLSTLVCHVLIRWLNIRSSKFNIKFNRLVISFTR